MNHENKHRSELRNKADLEYAENILATVRESLMILNSDLRIVSANPSFYKTFNVTPEETEQQLLYDLSNRQWNIPGLRKLLEEILSQKTTIEDLEINHLFETIGQKTMLLNARKIIKEGEELILLGIEDITERKQTEEILRQCSHIVSNSKDMLALINKKYTYLAVNNSYLSAFNCTSEQIIGHTVSEIFGKEIFKTVLKPYADRCMNGEKVHYQEWISFPKLGKRYLDIIYSPYINSENINQGFVVSTRDITEHKQADDVITQLSKFPSENPNPILSIKENKKVIYANNAAINVLHSECLKPGSSFNLWHDLIDESFATKTVKKITETKNKDRFYSWTLMPIKEKGWLNIYGNDITDRKHMEELALSQKLEAIGSLAGGIAHDFNNIMMIILGNISLAQSELSKDNPGLKYLEESKKSLIRATQLSSQLLTFSRGGAPIRSEISLGKLVEEIVNFDLSGSNVKFIFEKPKDLWVANVDKGQIQQVFDNLTINAKQAMANGGILRITLENTDIKEQTVQMLEQGKYIKCTVRDNGIGIKKKHIKHVFDPFYSTKEVGRGLGLATVYSIIKKHAGYISLDSELSKGTTFTLYLPASESLVNSLLKQPEVKKYSKIEQTARILVMDDEEKICKLLKKMLEVKGHSVSTASDGKQAIEMYKQSLGERKPFDTVILDLTIPGGIGGKEVIKELLKINPKVKGIVTSGYANDPVMANYKEYGFKGIITKPYTSKELQVALNQVLKE